jgi:chorismate--pyruvate lyase
MRAMHDAFFGRRSVVWRPASRLPHSTIVPHFRDWLLDPASLTQRLICACAGRFSVQVLDLGWDRPLPDERRRLGMRERDVALVRQVQLRCNEAVWVYARTIIPRTTLTGRERRLAHLGARPLGAALFADPTMERDPVEVARLTAGSVLFGLATRGLAAPPEEIWGRRSVFRLSGKPLLVSEIFMPQIPEAVCR